MVLWISTWKPKVSRAVPPCRPALPACLQGAWLLPLAAAGPGGAAPKASAQACICYCHAAAGALAFWYNQQRVPGKLRFEDVPRPGCPPCYTRLEPTGARARGFACILLPLGPL